MSNIELLYSIILSLVFALRMLGLFMISPLLPGYVSSLLHGDNYIFVGISLSIYNLTQCISQFPIGYLSDKYERKKIIIIGLSVTILGLIIFIFSKSIYFIILSRGVQGLGVISSVLTALVTDLIEKKNYFIVMSMVSFSVGISFLLSLISTNYIFFLIGILGIFFITTIFTLISLLLVYFLVPSVKPVSKSKKISVKKIFLNNKLIKLNFGVLILYLLQMFIFIVFPKILSINTHVTMPFIWRLYLPIILISYIILYSIILLKKIISFKKIFIFFIIIMFFIQIGFIIFFLNFNDSLNLLSFLFLIFLIVFNFLDTYQRSLVSKIFPFNKGTAMGIYSSFQSFGLFLGGLLGGIISRNNLIHITYVYSFFSFIVFIWLTFVLDIKYLKIIKNIFKKIKF